VIQKVWFRIGFGIFVLATLAALTWIVSARSLGGRTDLPLSQSQREEVAAGIALIQSKGLTTDAALATQLLQQGIWRAASPKDAYIRMAEDGGDTPFAYTLSGGHHPEAIVLAARFFDQSTTDTGRAALMIHEMGHYRAYVMNGKSTEYDGYKAEYDKSKRLGLSDKDGMVYFGMLDGVAEYVVPFDSSYGKKPDVKNYMDQPANE
jgi:hypothetical protein